MKIEEVDVEFAKITQSFRYTNPGILAESKRFFEKTLHSIGKYDLELKLIVDANIVLQESLALIKKGNSSLISLSKSPFFKIIAPTWLLEELDKKIPSVAEKNKVDKQVLRTAVGEVIKSITILEVRNEQAYIMAKQILGERDPEGKDAPYVALYLTVKSHGILTADDDIIAQKTIKTWNKVGFAGRVVSTFERGSISFLVLVEGIPIALAVLYEVTVAILNGIWYTLKAIGSAFMAIAVAGVSAISELPDWAISVIGVATVVIASWKEAREWIVKNILEPIRKTIIEVLKGVYEIIKEIISALVNILKIGVQMFAYLFEKVESTFTYYKTIDIGGGNAT